MGNTTVVTTSSNDPSEHRPTDTEDPSEPAPTTTLPTTTPADAIRPGGSRPIARALLAVEDVAAADGAANALTGLLHTTFPPAVLTFLRGQWLGHPLHPILVTVPIGAWMSVPLLDATGQRAAAQRLVAFGLIASLPAAITGLAEYTTLDTPQRRVALFHMAANTIGLGCFARSWRKRRRGNEVRGSFWSLAGLTVSGVSGALGGHLSYAQGAGVRRERSTDADLDRRSEIATGVPGTP